MKKMVFLALVIFLLAAMATANAGHRHHDWSDQAYHNDSWQPTNYHDKDMPFRWHERHNRFLNSHYRLERIYDREWDHRFPGLRAFRWSGRQGEGFWYRGHRINNAVLFYNHDDELVSIGFRHDGAFIFIRDDHNSFESHDRFFFNDR